MTTENTPDAPSDAVSRAAVLDAIDGIADTNVFGIRRPHEMRTVFRDVVRSLPTAEPTARGEVETLRRVRQHLECFSEHIPAAFEVDRLIEEAMAAEARAAQPAAVVQPSGDASGVTDRRAIEAAMSAPHQAPAEVANVEALLRGARDFGEGAGGFHTAAYLIRGLATALRASEAKRVEVERDLALECKAQTETCQALAAERAAHAETRADRNKSTLVELEQTQRERDAQRARSDAAERTVLRVCQALGCVYQAEGHNDAPADEATILDHIEQLSADAGQQRARAERAEAEARDWKRQAEEAHDRIDVLNSYKEELGTIYDALGLTKAAVLKNALVAIAALREAAEAKLAALDAPIAAEAPEKCPVDAAYLERWRHGIVDTADCADEAPYIGQVRAMARALAWCADEIQRLSGGVDR